MARDLRDSRGEINGIKWIQNSDGQKLWIRNWDLSYQTGFGLQMRRFPPQGIWQFVGQDDDQP